MMELTYRSFRFMCMTEQLARTICSWNYEPPYDRYNWEPWDVLLLEGRELADADIRRKQFRSVWLGKELCGYVQAFPLASDRTQGTIRLGLGLRPDLCGRGWGSAFARAAAGHSASRFPSAEIDLEVAADNERAVKAYQRAGFTETDRYIATSKGSPVEVLCMVWANL